VDVVEALQPGLRLKTLFLSVCCETVCEKTRWKTIVRGSHAAVVEERGKIAYWDRGPSLLQNESVVDCVEDKSPQVKTVGFFL